MNGQRIGYARVSTTDQDTAVQEEQLREFISLLVRGIYDPSPGVGHGSALP